MAVTLTRIRLPTEAEPSSYLSVVAPPIAVQSDASAAPPELGQRVHWYSYEVGDPVQVPFEADNVDPTTGEPVIWGSAVFTGATRVASFTAVVGLDATVFAPSAFDAVTRTRSRLPTSCFSTRYVEAVCPEALTQSDASAAPPVLGQRIHW